MSGAAWTDERIEKLKALWARGDSGSQIARALGGVTRNAVIGKAFRMKLPSRFRPSTPGLRVRSVKPRAERPVRQPRPPKPTRYVNVRNVVHNVEARKRDPGVKALPVALRTFPLAKPWLERKFGECAFPVGEGADTLSCCNPTERTYCRTCEAVMYQPIQPTMSKTLRLARLGR